MPFSKSEAPKKSEQIQKRERLARPGGEASGSAKTLPTRPRLRVRENGFAVTGPADAIGETSLTCAKAALAAGVAQHIRIHEVLGLRPTENSVAGPQGLY